MRRNPLIVLLALSALLLSTTGSALADSHDEYIAEASGVGFSLSVLGEGPFVGGLSATEINSDPFADAYGLGFELFDDSESSATATSDGEHEQDEGSATGALPDELGFIGDLIDSHSSAEAGITDGLPFASADATGLDLRLSTEPLAEILGELVVELEVVTDEIDSGLDELEAQVLSEVRAALIEACEAAIDGTDPLWDGVSEALGQLTDPLPEDFDELRDELSEIIEDLADGHACERLFNILTNPPGIGELLEALILTLEDLTLLHVTLADSNADTDAVPAQVVAAAAATSLEIRLPSVAELGDALDNVIQVLVDDFLDDVIERYEDVVSAVTDPLPEEIAGPLGDLLGLLTNDDPILSITAGDTSAVATFDRDTGAISTEGTAAPLQVCMAGPIIDLIGGEEGCLTIEEGGAETILEDTPLESRLAAGAVTMSSAERDGLEGEEVISEAVALQLINFEDDDFVLEVASAESYAAVFGEVTVADEPEALPVTGGSAVPIALLLLAAGMLFTRRMRAPLAEREAS